MSKMSLLRTLFVSGAFGLASVGTPNLALAGGSGAPTADEGVPVTVQVLDVDAKPIPTAVVRQPQEADRHRVNTFDGKWTASVLYMPDGSELVFTKGMTLELEISAPGYINQKVDYLIRKRKNTVTVTLQKMNFDINTDQTDDPVIQFGRDKPIDGAGSDPAN
jgi:hypothetical protein